MLPEETGTQTAEAPAASQEMGSSDAAVKAAEGIVAQASSEILGTNSPPSIESTPPLEPVNEPVLSAAPLEPYIVAGAETATPPPNPDLPNPGEAVVAAENLISESQIQNPDLTAIQPDVDPAMSEANLPPLTVAPTEAPAPLDNSLLESAGQFTAPPEQIPSASQEAEVETLPSDTTTHAGDATTSTTSSMPVETGKNLYGLSDQDALKVGEARAWPPKTTPDGTTPLSPDFQYSNITTGESGLTNTQIAPQVDSAIDKAGENEPNPGFESPIATASSDTTETSTGILNLAQIRELAESKRKVALLEEKISKTITENPTAAVGLLQEANQDVTQAITEANNEPTNTGKLNRPKRALIPLVLLAGAIIPRDTGPENTDSLTSENSGFTSQISQKVEDTISNDSSTALQRLTGEIDQTPVDAIPVSSRPPDAVDPIPPIVGSGLSNEFKQQQITPAAPPEANPWGTTVGPNGEPVPAPAPPGLDVPQQVVPEENPWGTTVGPTGEPVPAPAPPGLDVPQQVVPEDTTTPLSTTS